MIRQVAATGRHRALALILLAICLWGFSLESEGASHAILIVVNSDAPIDSISQSEAANLYLGLTYRDGITPFDQKDQAARKTFYRVLSGMSQATLRAHWAKRVFSGRGRPPNQISKEDIQKQCASSSNGMTYVFGDHAPDGCKVILELDATFLK